MQPGDVLLVEGETFMSTAIQYLTTSTWSHVCFYAGNVYQEPTEAEPRVLIEADLVEGVIAVPLSKYAEHNIRICRPVGLSEEDTKAIVDFMINHIGLNYDLKNIFDLIISYPRHPCHGASDGNSLPLAVVSPPARFAPR